MSISKISRIEQRKKFTWSTSYECCLECGTIEKKHRAHGLCSSCYARKYNEKNREYLIEAHKDYYKANAKKKCAQTREYYNKNKPRILARNKTYLKEYMRVNKEVIRKKRRERDEKNKVKLAVERKERYSNIKNTAEFKRKRKEYYVKNKVKINARAKAYYEKNKKIVLNN